MSLSEDALAEELGVDPATALCHRLQDLSCHSLEKEIGFQFSLLGSANPRRHGFCPRMQSSSRMWSSRQLVSELLRRFAVDRSTWQCSQQVRTMLDRILGKASANSLSMLEMSRKSSAMARRRRRRNADLG